MYSVFLFPLCRRFNSSTDDQSTKKSVKDRVTLGHFIGITKLGFKCDRGVNGSVVPRAVSLPVCSAVLLDSYEMTVLTTFFAKILYNGNKN